MDGCGQQCGRHALLLRHEACTRAWALARQRHPGGQNREALISDCPGREDSLAELPRTAISGHFATALHLTEVDIAAIESPDLREHSLEPLAHQHCHTLTGSSRRKERDIAALLIKQVRQRSVLDEIRARFLRIDLAEIQLVACRDAADLRFAPA